MKNRIIKSKHAELVRSSTLERDLRWMKEKEGVLLTTLMGRNAILEEMKREQDRLLRKSFEILSHKDDHIRFHSPEPCWQ